MQPTISPDSMFLGAWTLHLSYTRVQDLGFRVSFAAVNEARGGKVIRALIMSTFCLTLAPFSTSYELQSKLPKGGYLGDHIGQYYRG